MTHRFSSLILTALIVVALVSAGVFRVWTRTESLRLGYSIAQAHEESERLLADRARLQAEVATLKSPIRVRKLASAKLGLQPPVPEQVIAIRHRPASLGQRLARNDID